MRRVIALGIDDRKANLDRRQFDAAVRELGDLSQEWDAAKTSIVYLKSCFLKFLIGLSRAFVGAESREMGFQFRPAIWKALDRVEEAIADSQKFRVSRLAREVGVSTDHFSKTFRSATGWSPMHYFQLRRIHHACNLLLNPQNSITEVGHQLGYSDAAHLCRFFKQHIRMTPRAYRKRYTCCL